MKPTDPNGPGQRPILALRLVHPAPPKPTRGKSRRRHEGRLFTTEEHVRLRSALSNTAKAVGGWQKLAALLDVSPNTLWSARRHYGVSAALAVRLARVAGVSLDAILRPGLALVKDPCPACGKPDGAA